MPNELEIAKHALAEVEQELNRVKDQLRAELAKRSSLMREIAAASSNHQIEELIALLDRSKAMDQVIDNLSNTKRNSEAKRRRVEQKVKAMRLKADRLQQTIREVEQRLSPSGEVGRQILDSEKTLKRFSPEGDIGRQIKDDERALERLLAGGDLAQELREAQHTLEMQLRVREAIETDLANLRRRLAQLTGSEDHAAGGSVAIDTPTH